MAEQTEARDERGDTPAQAKARGDNEETLGASSRTHGSARTTSEEKILARDAGKEFTVYHPHGFAVPVVGRARAEELISRGYTTEGSGRKSSRAKREE